MCKRSRFGYCLKTGWLLGLVGWLLAACAAGASAGAGPAPEGGVARFVPVQLAAAPGRQATAVQSATPEAGQTPGAQETLGVPEFLTATQTVESLPVVITATATLIPFPSITYQFPQVTATAQLLSLERIPGAGGPPKDQRTTGWKAVRFAWPLLLLVVVWLGLVAWFLAALMLIGRR
jgi:hypothetical protein